MKPLLIILLVIPAYALFSQNSDCRVMISDLQGTYQGGCKKGLAQGKGNARGKDRYSGYFKNGYPHGEGVYTWASGNMYKGSWRNGLRDGEGTFTGTVNGRDSVMTGIWKEDHYQGPKPSAPKIIQSYNIISTSFNRSGEGSKITISFYQNGMNNSIESLEIVSDSGTENRSGPNLNIWNIAFPFHCKLNYLSWNSLRTVQYNCILEFEIKEPGSWDLRIGN